MATLLVILAVVIVPVLGWLHQRAHKRHIARMEAIEQAAYRQCKAAWDVWFEQLYALNPSLRPKD